MTQLSAFYQRNRLPEVKYYALKYAKAESAAKVIQSLKTNAEMSVAVDERTNGLVVMANQEAQQEIQKLIEQIDVNVPEDNERAVTQEYAVADHQVAELERYLLQARGAKFTFEQRREPDRGGFGRPGARRNGSTTVFTVTATSSVQTEIHKLLSDSASAPAVNRLLQVYWLLNSQEGSSELPDALIPVIEELDNLGVKNMRVATPMFLRTLVGEVFEAAGTAEPEAVGEKCRVTVQGKFDDSNRLNISLQANRESDKSEGNSTLAQLETSLTVIDGKPVVLGVGPVLNQTSAFVIIVGE
ncbi:MAG: hypothetical protein KDA60_14700 [Planctomycetales bacterium]|nr:hypothetical protein [Planctomycetales bacterium]